jgi:type III secretion protein C
MKRIYMKRWLMLLMITALFWSSSVQAATPASWKDTGFSINATGLSLREVLEEFGQVYGVRIAFNLKEDKTLSGRIKADSGSAFLDRLTHLYKFRWFVYNSTLYIVPAKDNVSVRLQIGEDAVQDAKAALVGLGLFESRFGWGELPDEGVVVVSGPRDYVNLVREVLSPASGKKSAKGKQIMVFRLKYASAADRIIVTRGQKETIPGVKTILTGLLNPTASSMSGDQHDKFDVSSEKRSRESKNGRGGMYELHSDRSNARAGSGRDRDEEGEGRRSKSGDTARGGPRIDADPTLNAILIYDDTSKREMYRALIAELDVEPRQIEIEALIVDIERSKLAEMGIEWGVRRDDKVVRINSTTTDSRGTDLPLPGSTLLISNAARFYARLKALEDSGEASVLAKPTVLTLDNVAAVLDLSQTSYVPLIGERVVDLADITAGTLLRVVPRIVQEGPNTRVRLEVDIEDGALGDQTQKNTVATRSTISTQAIIDLQQTLMIGGYHAESRLKNHQKVPVLGDIPLFGGLFRSNSDSHTDRERLFLITPRLLGTSGIPAPEQSKARGLSRRMVIIDQPALEAQAKPYAPSQPQSSSQSQPQSQSYAQSKPQAYLQPQSHSQLQSQPYSQTQQQSYVQSLPESYTPSKPQSNMQSQFQSYSEWPWNPDSEWPPRSSPQSQQQSQPVPSQVSTNEKRILPMPVITTVAAAEPSGARRSSYRCRRPKVSPASQGKPAAAKRQRS